MIIRRRGENRQNFEIKITPEQQFNYDLGQLTGAVIFYNYLPTLDIDSLQTRNVIVTTNSIRKAMETLDERWWKANQEKDKELSDSLFQDGLAFRRKIEAEYLPNKLECNVEKVKVTDLEYFHRGIEHYLWNTDLSHYSVKKEEEWFRENSAYSWCNTIILTRSKN